jgi:acyl-CoA thioester hydrolase
MGVVYHANYLVWMEVARVDYCRANGFRYKDLERDHGVLLAVTAVDCRYLSPARYDDEIEVSTTVTRAHHRAITFGYEIRSVPEAEGEISRLLATGSSNHIFLNRELRPTALPTQFRPMLGIFPENGK